VSPHAGMHPTAAAVWAAARRAALVTGSTRIGSPACGYEQHGDHLLSDRSDDNQSFQPGRENLSRRWQVLSTGRDTDSTQPSPIVTLPERYSQLSAPDHAIRLVFTCRCGDRFRRRLWSSTGDRRRMVTQSAERPDRPFEALAGIGRPDTCRPRDLGEPDLQALALCPRQDGTRDHRPGTAARRRSRCHTDRYRWGIA
jgi:hypothetical protein